MRIIKAIVLAALAGALALPASADLNIGGEARFTAMGGAGLASTVNPSATATMNPAALGLLPKRLQLQFPYMNFRSTGASIGSLNKWANDVWDLSGTDAIKFARDFGTNETDYDLNIGTGINGGPVSLLANGEARLRIIPNDSFKEFVRTGNLPADPSTMQATIWAEAGTAIPSVGLGFKVPKFATGMGNLWLGTRLRYVRGTYIRRTVSWSGSMDPNNPLQVSNEPAEKKSGLGGDFGLIYGKPGRTEMNYGLVATNLLKPGLGKVHQDTIWSMGVAAKPNSKTLIVADIVNLTGAYDENTALRMGVEFKPISAIALRAGYSENGFTTGFGLFGLDVAFASKSPLSISRTIRF